MRSFLPNLQHHTLHLHDDQLVVFLHKSVARRIPDLAVDRYLAPALAVEIHQGRALLARDTLPAGGHLRLVNADYPSYNDKDESQDDYDHRNDRRHRNRTSGERGIEQDHGPDHERCDAADGEEAVT